MGVHFASLATAIYAVELGVTTENSLIKYWGTAKSPVTMAIMRWNGMFLLNVAALTSGVCILANGGGSGETAIAVAKISSITWALSFGLYLKQYLDGDIVTPQGLFIQVPMAIFLAILGWPLME